MSDGADPRRRALLVKATAAAGGVALAGAAIPFDTSLTSPCRRAT